MSSFCGTGGGGSGVDGGSDGDTDADADGDADTDADGDADTDADGDADTDADGDADADADGDADADAGGDADAGAGGDADTDTDTETGSASCVDNGLRLVPDDGGWIDECSNTAGVQGMWTTFSDADSGGDATVTLNLDSAASGSVCAAGTVSEVRDDDNDGTPDWGTYWGAGIELTLCENDDDETPPGAVNTVGACPRDLSAVIGVRLTVTGALPDTELRVVFSENGRQESAYVPVAQAGTPMEYLFKDATVAHDPTALPIDVTNINSISLHVAAGEATSAAFDFCIEDVELILKEPCPAVDGLPGPNGPTYIDDMEITEDTSWTADKSPYIIEDGNVNIGGQNSPTLTIEACTLVKLSSSFTNIVAGRADMGSAALRVMGESDKPVRFTSAADPPAPGDWGDIYIGSMANTSELNFAVIEYAGELGSGYEAISIEGDDSVGPEVKLNNVTIVNNAATGLGLRDGARLHSDSANLQIHDNMGYAVNIDTPVVHTLPGGDTGSSFTGNQEDAIQIVGEALTEEVTWPHFDVPIEPEPDYNLDIDDGGKLTLSPGTVFHMLGNGILVGDIAGGALIAVGTEDAPIVFTSGANSKNKGDWDGILIDSHATAETKLDHVEIGYAGGGYLPFYDGWSCAASELAALHVFSEPVAAGDFLTNTLIHHSAGFAINFGEDIATFDPSLSTYGNSFADNEDDIAICTSK